MDTSSVNLLIVDDSPEDRMAVRRLLGRATLAHYTFAEAERGEQALAACRGAAPDCVLLDQRLPDMDGLAVLAALRAASDVPVILLTGAGSEALAVMALHQGAQDYLAKEMLTPERLHLTIERAIDTVRLTRERSQTQALLSELLEALPDGVAVLDAELRLIRANPSLSSRLGRPLDELLGQPLLARVPELGVLASVCEQVLRGERFYDLELALPLAGEGEPVWLVFSGTPVRLAAGAAPLILLTVRDCTERVRSEAILRQQAAMLDHAHVLIRDAESRIVSWNQGAQRLYGWTAEEAIGRVSHELFQTRFPTSQAQVHDQLFATGRWEGELIHRRRDGEEIVVASLKLLFRDASGKPQCILEVNNDVTALKKSELALREREEQLSLAQTAAQLGTWRRDLATGLVRLEGDAQAHFGLAADEVAVEAILAQVHPDDRAVWRQMVAQTIDPLGPGRASGEYRVVHADGGVHWLSIHSRAYFAGLGAERRLVQTGGTSQEITARKREEEALRLAYAQVKASAREAAAHGARLDSLLAYAPIGIGLLDPELRFQHVNAHLATINGLAPEAHLGRTIREVLPAFAEVLEQIYGQVLATGQPVLDIELVGETLAAPGEQRFWRSSYFPVRDAAQSLLGVGVVVSDITAQRQAEEARLAEHRQLEAILQTMDEGVIAFRPDGTIVVINALARRIAGIAAEAPLETLAEAKARLAITVGGSQAWPLVGGKMLSTRVLNGESFAQEELGFGVVGEASERWLAFSGTSLRGPGDAVDLAILTVRDITANKRDQAALAFHAESLSRTNAELTRALRLKDEFLAMMSHELRTPLNVVLGLSEALHEQIYGPLGERQRQTLATVMQSGRHLLAILGDILDLAHIEAGKAMLDLVPIDVDGLCRSALQYVQATAMQKDIRLLRTVEAGIVGLRADERRLTQILINLLDNAVKFTPVGGTVGLEVSADRPHEHLRFTVWDSGIGIAADDFERLFQPFTQVDGRLSRQYNGIGLGLTLVRRLVDLHGGSIALESVPGQGSRFTVSLPWGVEENLGPSIRQNAGSSTPAWARPPRVVLADDHEQSLLTTRDLLIEKGCEVAVARNGAEALALLRANRPDAAVLDIQMPVMDGLTAIRQIRADAVLAGLPVIALTALAMPGDRERCLEAGADAYLAKPVSMRTLVATLDAVLHQRAG